MEQYSRFHLLILDDFLIPRPSEQQLCSLLDLTEFCCRRCSLLLCSPVPVRAWYNWMGADDSCRLLCEAILDRIGTGSQRLELNGGESMRYEI